MRPEVADAPMGESYPAAHGFAVPDNPTHDDAADRRHREAVADLLAAHLTR